MAPNTQITDLGFVRGLRLESLAVSYSPLADLSPLAGHPTLRRLSIGGSQVRDFSVLATLPALVQVGAFGLPLESLAPFATLGLEELSIDVHEQTKLTRADVEAFKRDNPACRVLVSSPRGVERM